MAQKPEGKLLNTISDNDLSLTGKPALIQNNLGIFYGFLEKSDTRSGTALLRDGFKLSPDRHITFSQYLDFLSNEMSDGYWQAMSEFYDALHDSEDGSNDVDPSESLPDEEDIIPNEILITEDVFLEHSRELSITDYASEGVYLVQRRTSTHANSKHIQASAPLMSLTNVIAIVAISEKPIVHPELEETKKQIEGNGLLSDVGIYYDAFTPMATFGLIGSDLSLISLHAMIQETDKSNAHKVSELLNDMPRATRSLDYIANLIPEQVKEYINPEAIKDKTDLAKYIGEYCKALASIPALVVNSNQRVIQYKEKAQSNEQAN